MRIFKLKSFGKPIQVGLELSREKQSHVICFPIINSNAILIGCIDPRDPLYADMTISAGTIYGICRIVSAKFKGLPQRTVIYIVKLEGYRYRTGDGVRRIRYWHYDSTNISTPLSQKYDIAYNVHIFVKFEDLDPIMA